MENSTLQTAGPDEQESMRGASGDPALPLCAALGPWREGKGWRQRRREPNIIVGEKHQLAASCTPPTGDLAHNPGMCPDRASNQRRCGSQASAQSTEPHQPGQKQSFRRSIPLAPGAPDTYLTAERRVRQKATPPRKQNEKLTGKLSLDHICTWIKLCLKLPLDCVVIRP
ncbi:hypothetical protein HJG60_011403 [Phyllostomus discolor]|uniref:Uncharacterized protein n=1 Tax=Phyllostomus discolor TaxID=89673 RepID=A0A834A4T0_9CHIR|nr:hypothetical protein HJG60_011403 [Phyllostomus discolor]